MRANPALEYFIAVEKQVLRGDGGPDIGRRSRHVLHGLARRDVLEHHLEKRQALNQRHQCALDEYLLAIEYIDRRVGDLAMHQERNPKLGHRFKRFHRLGQIGDTRVRIGRRPRRVVLERLYKAGIGNAPDLVRRRVVGEVQSHERFKRRSVRHRGENAFAVRRRLGHRAHRGFEVWHDDGAAELAHGGGQDRAQGRTIAYVKVPVVGGRQIDVHR